MTSWRIETPQNQSDIDQLCSFCKIVHGDHPSIFDAIFYKNPCVPWESHRFIRHEGQIVAMVSLLPRQQLWAGQVIATAEIGLVGTHPDYRKQGLARDLMNDSLAAATRQGVQWLFLYGIPHFYESFDFAYAWPSYHPRVEITVDKFTQWPETPAPKYRLRPYQPKDLPGLMACYQQVFNNNPGTIVRPEAYWHYQLTALAQQGYELESLINMRGQVAGYCWWEKSPQWKVVEAVSPAMDGSIVLLQSAHKRLQRSGQNTLGLQIPQNQRFAQDILERGGCFYSTHSLYPGVWAGMVRLVDWPGLLKQSLDLFNQRLAQSRWYDWNGSLILGCGAKSIQLHIQAGTVTLTESESAPLLHLSRAQWSPLLLGYRQLSDFAVDLSQSEQAILDVLFPRQYPFMSEIDSYG